ncbi:unnamed protein product [Rotaria sp. Silwood1]|nr:unnamed protein product [Rotaria sp. Silwood1]
MSARCIQTTVRNVQTLLMINSRRHFQTSVLRLSADVFHVKDDGDFQKEVLDSKKPFIVDFHAAWCGPCKILVVAIKNGREISRFTGVVDEKIIQKMIDQLNR